MSDAGSDGGDYYQGEEYQEEFDEFNPDIPDDGLQILEEKVAFEFKLGKNCNRQGQEIIYTIHDEIRKGKSAWNESVADLNERTSDG